MCLALLAWILFNFFVISNLSTETGLRFWLMWLLLAIIFILHVLVLLCIYYIAIYGVGLLLAHLIAVLCKLHP